MYEFGFLWIVESVFVMFAAVMFIVEVIPRTDWSTGRRRRKLKGYLSLWAKSWLKALDIALHNIHYNLSRTTRPKTRYKYHGCTSHYCKRIYSSRQDGQHIIIKVGRRTSTTQDDNASPCYFAARTYTATDDTTTTPRSHALPASFDSDSFQIAIDNCASNCMTNCESDFIDTPTTIDRPVWDLASKQPPRKGLSDGTSLMTTAKSMHLLYQEYYSSPTFHFGCCHHNTGHRHYNDPRIARHTRIQYS